MLSHGIIVIFWQLSLILIHRQKKHTQTHTHTQSIWTLLVQKFICKKWQMSSGPLGPMFYPIYCFPCCTVDLFSHRLLPPVVYQWNGMVIVDAFVTQLIYHLYQIYGWSEITGVCRVSVSFFMFANTRLHVTSHRHNANTRLLVMSHWHSLQFNAIHSAQIVDFWKQAL